MVIFNSYVKLPEGIRAAEDHLACFVGAERGVVAVPKREEDAFRFDEIWHWKTRMSSHIKCLVVT